MNVRKTPLFLLLFFGTLFALLDWTDSDASNGIKPPAVGSRQFGRAGAGLAFMDDATSMHVNPALLTQIYDEKITVAPIFFQMDAVYSDNRNTGVRSKADSFMLANTGFVMDFDETKDEIRRDLDEYRPYFDKKNKDYSSLPDRPRHAWETRTLDLSVTVKNQTFPQNIAIIARGPGEVYDLSITADYQQKSRVLAFSKTLASSDARAVAGAYEYETVAVFGDLKNKYPYTPDAIRIAYKVHVQFKGANTPLSVRVRFDDKDVGGTTTMPKESEPPALAGTPPVAPPAYNARLAKGKDSDNPSTVKFGFGEVIQSGAGSDMIVNTEMYPGGAPFVTDLGFLSFAPSVGWQVNEWMAVGVSLQINYAFLNQNSPITEDYNLLQGETFPVGSLEEQLASEFGIPNVMGPALAKIFARGDTHAPGTSITHSDKPDDKHFERKTGMVKIEDTESFGFSSKIGFVFNVTPRLKVALTYQSKTRQEDFTGSARLDFNQELATLLANPTVGHSDEIAGSLLCGGAPAELRMTFDQVWNQGTVNVHCNGVFDQTWSDLASSAMTPLKDHLPNQGSEGYSGDYDVIVEDWQMPREIALGTAYLLADWLTVMVDYKRIFWSETMDTFKVKLKNGTNADLNHIVGGNSIAADLPLHWADQNVYMIGFEAMAYDWLLLRAGWNHGDNPIPSNTLLPFVPAITEDHLAAGFTVMYNEAFEFDFAWTHAFRESQTVGSSLHGPDFDNSTLTVAQDFIVLGISYAF